MSTLITLSCLKLVAVDPSKTIRTYIGICGALRASSKGCFFGLEPRHRALVTQEVEVEATETEAEKESGEMVEREGKTVLGDL